MDRKKAQKIYRILQKIYPKATTALIHKDPFQLLVATILSAQCTDVRVNMVTKGLFKKYRDPGDFAQADSKALEDQIKSTGFYKNKAKNIIAASKMIIRQFGGRVPQAMEELVQLPGVARKTANIVLFHGFNKNEGIAVDTHVKRLSGRLHLSGHTYPVKIEKDLMELFPRDEWGLLTNLFIAHGRKVCSARKPSCQECALNKLCPSAKDLYPEVFK
ncbi:MAG: endonuclease III [Candidatus Omnitrophica bacterium]|nr:endonuclease III [Candidatus Omnitrophota bacterium]